MNTLSPSPHSTNSPLIEPDTLFFPAIAINAAIRVGSVPYLNAKPLTRGLHSFVKKLEPSALAVEMRAGHLNVGLVPIMEVLEAGSGFYRVANDIGIGSERAVFSVYVNHICPLAKIKTVSLDPASKTSVELARIVLEKFHHLKPRYVSPDEPADAQLLIGDPAILHRQAYPEQNYLDLAEEWREFTSLPFVFAVWAIRLPYWRGRWVAHQLRQAKRIGLAHREQIARSAFERQYLSEHLSYELGPRQKRSISLFANTLSELGRLETVSEIKYI